MADTFSGFSYGPAEINEKTGRVTQSYENMMGRPQPAHQGSQSSSPTKEETNG